MDYLKILNIFNNTKPDSSKSLGDKQDIHEKTSLTIQEKESIEAKIKNEQYIQEVARKAAEEAADIQRLKTEEEARRRERINIEELERSIEEAKLIEIERKDSIEKAKKLAFIESKNIINTKKINAKISFIMQVNLDNYLGQVQDPITRFIDAVESFLIQTDKESELVIIADGCFNAMKIYLERFQEYDRIKFAFIDKNFNEMHNYKINNKNFYRSNPRAIGLLIASGEWITYLNANDMIIPTAVEILKMEIKKWPENINFIFAQSKYVNPSIEIPIEKKTVTEKNITFNFLPGIWRGITYKSEFSNLFDCKADSYIHKKSYNVIWKDLIDQNPAYDVSLNVLKPDNINNVGVCKQPYYINVS